MRELNTSGTKVIIRVPDNYSDKNIYNAVFINDGDVICNNGLKDFAYPGCILIGLVSENRLDEYTPWHESAIRKGAPDFGGRCDEYHVRLTQQIVPLVAGEYNINMDTIAYGGYSLGGLAAVYSLFRDDTFANIFSVCGSFWYPGFTEYISSTPVVNRNAYVRLINGENEGSRHGNILEEAPVKAHYVHEHLSHIMNVCSSFDEYGHHEHHTERIQCALEDVLKHIDGNNSLNTIL